MFQVRPAVFAAVRMAHRYPWRPATIAIGAVVLAQAVDGLGWHAPAKYLTPTGVLTVLACTAWWWLRHVARPHDTKTVIARRAELDQRCGGVATRLDIAEHASVTTLRRKATVLRPSLRHLSWWARRFIKASELGVEIVRLGWGWWGERLWSSCEDATFRIGGPRTGKTLSLACHGVDAPGALITTSTRLDLAEMVHAARTKRGTVHVFNPAGLGGLASTIRWRVLAGCADFTVAQRRAADLIPESHGEAERWDSQARRILALLLHAAEISNRSMRDVVRWAGDPTIEARDEVIDALLSVEIGGRDRAQVVRDFWRTNDRTRTSITTTMATPLAWMSDDRARLLGDAHRDDPQLVDLTRLIERGETLHLIGHEDHTGLSPLIAALVAEIAHAARTLASNRPGGRLDPPLTMLLDEAALVCPVPLDRWTADMGGRGVTLHTSVQSLSQLRQRWGDDGAGTILANVAAFIVFGGSPSSGDLRDISLLTGEHRMRVVGVDEDHPDAHRWVPVMSPAQIRAMEPGQVLVMLRGLHTVVGWAPRITKRRGWKPVSLLNTTTATASTTTTVGKPRRPVHDLTDRTEVPSAAELEAMLQTTPDPDRRSTHDSDDSRTASNGEQGHGRRIRGWSWNFGRRTDGASPDEHGRGRR
ncbi:MAG: type IV secretory system conjugative DNA transfer family protein [Actinomycetales bacterium]|nr:type IV secretory system conjugative DNA transfer family protein [Actinomycetales bacterium]